MGDFAFKAMRDFYFEEDVVLFVFAREDLPFGHDFRDERVLALGNAELDHFAQRRNLLDHPLHQFVETDFIEGRELDDAGIFDAHLLDHEAVFKPIDFVEDGDEGPFGGAELFENGVGRLGLHVGVGIAHVDEMDEDVGVGGLFESAFEGGDELVRDFADEADGVDEEDRLFVGEDEFARGGIEGSEELIFDEHVGVCERAEKR